MVSEDSDQVVSGLFSIHRLSDLRYVRKTQVSPMDTARDQLYTARELFEIALLRRMQLVYREERDDRLDQLAPTAYHESIQVLSVVVVAPVGDHASHSEKAPELM